MFFSGKLNTTQSYRKALTNLMKVGFYVSNRAGSEDQRFRCSYSLAVDWASRTIKSPKLLKKSFFLICRQGRCLAYFLRAIIFSRTRSKT